MSRRSSLAVWSLVFGLLSLLGICVFVVPAIVCGHIALSRVNRSGGTLRGAGAAIAGLAMGYTGIIISLFVGLALMLLPAMVRARELAQRSVCQSNLHQLDLALSAYCYPPRTSYPTNLWDLPPEDISPSVLVCPHAGTRPGTLETAGEWTDYIYVQGQGPGSPAGRPLIICPPINHKGAGGDVLYADHTTRWVPAAELDRIIADLYSPTSGCKVAAGTKLAQRSGGKYKSKQ